MWCFPSKKPWIPTGRKSWFFSLPQAAWKTWHRLWFIDPPTHTIWTLYQNIPKMVHNRCARCNLFNFQVLTMLTTFKMLPMLSYWMCCDWSRPRFDILSIYASASKNLKKMNGPYLFLHQLASSISATTFHHFCHISPSTLCNVHARTPIIGCTPTSIPKVHLISLSLNTFGLFFVPTFNPNLP